MAKPAQKTAPKAAAVKVEEPVPVAVPAKKSLGMMLGIMLLGLLAGGGAAGGYFMFLGPKAEARAAQKAAAAKAADALVPPETLKIDRMVLPMLTHEGELHGYVTLEMVLELERDSSEFVKARVPMIRHEFNATLAKQSMLGKDNQAPDFALADQLLTKAANTALGQTKVRKVNIVTAVPL